MHRYIQTYLILMSDLINIINYIRKIYTYIL